MSVAVRNLVFNIVGVLVALWMVGSRALFGVAGPYTWWYLALIGVPYVVLQLWLTRRLRIASDRGRTAGRAPYVAMVLSWTCAVGFGIMAPDLVNGELTTLIAHLTDEGWIGMSIALSNPLGIIAFVMMIAAVVFAWSAGREPRPEEDEFDGEPQMVPHPLERER